MTLNTTEFLKLMEEKTGRYTLRKIGEDTHSLKEANGAAVTVSENGKDVDVVVTDELMGELEQSGKVVRDGPNKYILKPTAKPVTITVPA